MRITIGCILLTMAAGCASHQQTASAPEPQPICSAVQCDGFASSLVFDPPIAAGEAPLILDREDREPSAFVGYEDQTITYSDVRSDDRQTVDRGGIYGGPVERRAISERVGTTTR